MEEIGKGSPNSSVLHSQRVAHKALKWPFMMALSGMWLLSSSEIALRLFLIRHKLGHNFQSLPMNQTRGSQVEPKGSPKSITSALTYPVSKQT